MNEGQEVECAGGWAGWRNGDWRGGLRRAMRARRGSGGSAPKARRGRRDGTAQGNNPRRRRTVPSPRADRRGRFRGTSDSLARTITSRRMADSAAFKGPNLRWADVERCRDDVFECEDRSGVVKRGLRVGHGRFRWPARNCVACGGGRLWPSFFRSFDGAGVEACRRLSTQVANSEAGLAVAPASVYGRWKPNARGDRSYAVVNRRVCFGIGCNKKRREFNGVADDSRSIQSVQQDRGGARRGLSRNAPGMDAHGTSLQPAAWGVRTKAAPGGRDGLIGSIKVRGIDAGERGGWEPPRRLMRRAVRPEPQAVVRSTLPEAGALVPAEVRAPVRRVVHGVVRSPVRGEARTGEARSAAKSPTSAARSAGERSMRRLSRRCGRTWRRSCRAGSGGERSEPPGKRAATEGNGGERDCSGMPGREAARPDSSYASVTASPSSAPLTAPESAPASPSPCAPSRSPLEASSSALSSRASTAAVPKRAGHR